MDGKPVTGGYALHVLPDTLEDLVGVGLTLLEGHNHIFLAMVQK
jgi:hypothetical protein